MYGTTDDWEQGEPDDPVPGEKDVGYLLDSLSAFMPEAQLDHSKVQFVYSGFRPLLSRRGESKTASEASREDLIEQSKSVWLRLQAEN